MEPIRLAALFAVVSYVFIGFEGFFAYFEEMFSPKQMQKSGRKFGMPWITHGGAFFGDTFLVTPATAYAISRYALSWRIQDHVLQVGIVWLINAIFHWVWSRQKMPDCLACYGRLKLAGIPHFLYMGFALTFLVMFYFDTTVRIDPKDLVVISLVLGFHLFIGCHTVPSLWNVLAKHVPSFGLQPLSWWKINTLKDPGALIPLVGCWIALFFRSRWLILHN